MDAGTIFVDECELKCLAHAPPPAFQVLPHGPDTLPGNKRKDRHPDHIGDRVAEYIGHLLVDKGCYPLCIHHPDTLVEVLDEEPVAILALPQDLLHPPPPGCFALAAGILRKAQGGADMDEAHPGERFFTHRPA